MDEPAFIAAYPATSNAELAARFGVSPITIQKWAARHGLKKDPDYRAQVQRQNAEKRVVTAETRERLRAKALGRQASAATRAKLSAIRKLTAPRGERHYRWKGGRPWQRFREPRYIEWRAAVHERDHYVCQQCQWQCKKYEKGLAAHHLQPYASYPDLRYVVSNGVTLCRQCHLTLHGNAPVPKEPIPCACGCGTLILPVDPYGRPRRYVNHHVPHHRMAESTKQKLREQRQGKPLSLEHRAKIARGLRTSSKRIGRPPRDADPS